MKSFFTLMSNSGYDSRAPWALTITNGLKILDCPICKQSYRTLGEAIEITLQQNKGAYWPDMIACGHYPLFIVSTRVIEVIEKVTNERLPLKPVRIVGQVPRKLKSVPVPEYVCVDGENCSGAMVDLDALGYVNARICAGCRYISMDVEATFERQAAREFPIEFRPGSWSGKNLFTTNLSPTMFFCTDRILELAGKYHFTNFRFDPIERGLSPNGPGVDYLRDEVR